MKAMKILGLVFAVLVLVLAGGIALIASKFDAARVKSEAAAYVHDKMHRTLKIDGDLRLSFWPNVGVRFGKVSLSERDSEQNFASIAAARVSVAVLPLLSRQVVVDTVRLEGLNANFVKHKDGTLNIADLLGGGQPAAAGAKEQKEAVEGGGASLQLDIGGIDISRAAIVWRDEQSGSTTDISGLDLKTGRIQADGARQLYSVSGLALAVKGSTAGKAGPERFDLKLDAPKLSVTPGKSSGEGITLAAELNGKQRNVKLKLALSDVEGEARTVRVGKLAIDVDAQTGQSAVQGRLDTPMTVDLDKQTVALDRIAGNFDVKQPGRAAVKLALSGDLRSDLKAKSAAGKLQMRIDESMLDTRFDIGRFSPLAMNFSADLDKFNLDKYLPPSKPDGKAAGGNAEGGGKPAAGEGRLDFSALEGPEVRGDIRIGQLQARNLKLGQLAAKLRLAGGKLDVAPMTASFYQGKLNGALSVNAHGNAVTLRQDLVGVNLAPLLKDAAKTDLIEGSGKVSFDVDTRGETVGQMKKRLAGKASLALGKGAIKGIDLERSLAQVQMLLGKKQPSTATTGAGARTTFSALTASFRIADGVARNDDLLATSPLLKVTGSGDVDIGENRLNYLVKAGVAGGASADAKGWQKLKGVNLPVRLAGSLDKPSWKIDADALAGEAAKAAGEQAKQRVEEKVKGKLQDALKGLFGK